MIANSTGGVSNSLVPDLATLLVGGIITLVVTVFAKYVWKWYQRPQIQIENVRQAAKEEESDLHVATYQAYVQNTGRSAAENCKPRIHFKGKQILDYKEENATVLVDAFSCWSEHGKPARITINKDEIVPLDIFRVYEDYRDGTFDPEEDRKVRFPSREGWKTYSPVEFQHDDLDVARQEESFQAIENTMWDEAYIEVTAANADKTQKDIDLSRISDVTRINFPNGEEEETVEE